MKIKRSVIEEAVREAFEEANISDYEEDDSLELSNLTVDLNNDGAVRIFINTPGVSPSVSSYLHSGNVVKLIKFLSNHIRG